ncbi:MAG: ABC transporter permease [Desulfoarculaceae bacterium]|nr:ABC transporter permease [Desulfoarculaceae bacterium]
MLKAMLIKEIILLWRDKQALAALFVMPAIFILIMSIALKDTLSPDRVLLTYAVVDQDNTAESSMLRNFLHENRAMAEQEVTIISAAQGQELLNGTVHFILTISEGFSRHLAGEQDLPPEGPPRLQVVAAPEVKAEMLTLVQAELAKAVLRLRIQTMRKELTPFLPELARKLEKIDFEGKELVSVRFSGMEAGLQPTSTQQSVPSWIIFGMFFVIIPMSTVFINERRQNTLMRMSAMNISVPTLFTGKIAPYLVINQIQVWLMIGVGLFLVPLFGGDALTLGDSLPGLFMVSLGLSLAAIGTSVLIAVLAGTVEQATTVGGIINILMGAIGGIMVPKSYMPPAMQNLANLSPMSWGLEGFLDIFVRGRGAEAVITESLALTGFGIGLLLVAGIIFRSQRGRTA